MTGPVVIGGVVIGRVRRGGIGGALLGWSASMTPGALPRQAGVVTLAGIVCASAGLALGALTVWLYQRRTARPERSRHHVVLAALTAVAAVAAAIGLAWQIRLTSAIGLPPPGPAWVSAAVVVPCAVVAAVLWVPWQRTLLGALAAAVLAAGLHAAPAQAARPNVPDSPLLHYAHLDGRDDAPRSAALIAQWQRDGGAEQRAVVVAVPTGSGWVDAAAVDGLQRRFGGSVRVLALQYSAVPSWQAYLRSPARAGESATALLRAVADAVGTVEPARRPRIYLYGQSLGATGADAARQWARDHGVPLDGTVLVGMPGGGEPAAGEPDPTRIVVNNPSDPVARLRLSLLWTPPGHPRAADRARQPSPPWIPGLSALATVVDLLGALEVPAGYGHRYGVEQGLIIPDTPSA